MPTLQFKGKTSIWNHHLSIPYHTLDEVKELHYSSVGTGSPTDTSTSSVSGNLIIEGDNLLALKALLPQYAGRVKCIYIDPPYNTGTENGNGKGWVYNDNVNSPLVKEWLGKEVGKDDLTRHDKWLCMMVPRLRLLRELLSDDGAIFISIDDNELKNLLEIMEEIFGEKNFRNIVIIRRGIKSVQAQFETVDKLNYGCEYVVIFTKNENYRFTKFEIELENGKESGWNNHWRGTDRPSMRDPIFGIKPETGQWRWGKQRNLIAIENYKELLKDVGKNEINITQEEIDEWYNKNLEETGEEVDLLRLSTKQKPEHYIPSSETKLASTHWSDLKPNGSSQLKSVFGKKVFENPKSTDLIKRVIKFIEGNNQDSIILDSFAGSGTTMHAVMELNKEDGGTRKCIMIQMTEANASEPKKNICKDITRERVKRAIEKFGYDSGFQYLRVGRAIDPENILAGDLPFYEEFAKYVYYLCTGEHLKNEKEIKADKYFVGKSGSYAIYLVYKPDFEEMTRLALNLTLAEKMKKDHPNERLIVYAPACFLDEEYLEANQIEYVNIPYGMFGKVKK